MYFPWNWCLTRSVPSLSSFREYLRANDLALDAVARHVDAALVVDSSKSPARLYWLARHCGARISAIHVVRDSRAVAWSWGRTVPRPEARTGPVAAQQMPRRNYWSAILRWGLNCYISFFVMRLLRVQPLLVKYEDLATMPDREIDRVITHLGMTGSDGTDDREFHSISGNPRRLTEKDIPIKPDMEWQSSVGPVKRRIAYLLNLYPNLRLGYRI